MSDQEREVKFYIQDLEAMADRLQACGADLVRQRTFELNLRFDTAFHELQKSGRLLRLRQDDRARVTFKGNAHVEGSVIARNELEFTVDDFAVARRLFEAWVTRWWCPTRSTGAFINWEMWRSCWMSCPLGISSKLRGRPTP